MENLSLREALAVFIVAFSQLLVFFSLADRTPVGDAASKFKDGIEVLPAQSHFLWDANLVSVSFFTIIVYLLVFSLALVLIWGGLKSHRLKRGFLDNRLEGHSPKYATEILQFIIFSGLYIGAILAIILIQNNVQYCTSIVYTTPKTCNNMLFVPDFPVLLIALWQGVTVASVAHTHRIELVPGGYSNTNSLKMHLSNWWRIAQLTVTGWFSLFVGASLSIILNRTNAGMKMIAELGVSSTIGLLAFIFFILIKSRKVEEKVNRIEEGEDADNFYIF